MILLLPESRVSKRSEGLPSSKTRLLTGHPLSGCWSQRKRLPVNFPPQPPHKQTNKQTNTSNNNLSIRQEVGRDLSSPS